MLDHSLVTSRALGSNYEQSGAKLLIHSERADGLPLLLAHFDRMQVPALLEARLGATDAASATVWLAALLNQSDLRRADLATWVGRRQETLRRCSGHTYDPEALSEGRLLALLQALGSDEVWGAIAHELDGGLSRQFGLPAGSAPLLSECLSKAHSARRDLHDRLSRAQAAIEALNHRRRGKFTRLSDLRSAAEALLAEHEVSGLVRVSYDEVVQERRVRRYRGRPEALRIQREIRVSSEVDAGAVADAAWRLGWWSYAATTPPASLSAARVLLAQRSADMLVRSCDPLDSELDLTALPTSAAHRQALGLLRLLSIGVRAYTLIEHLVTPHLPGLHSVGAPPREPATGEWVLDSFRELTLTIVEELGQVRRHFTPLSPLQRNLLDALDLPQTTYDCLAE